MAGCALGRVDQRTADGFRQFVYQGPDMLRLQMEKRDNGDTVAQYTIGARGALEAQRRGETSTVHHFDMLGSTLALTRPHEAVTDTYRYEVGAATASGPPRRRSRLR